MLKKGLRDPGPVVVLWLAFGAVLAPVTSQVRDWFDMTDEMRYERLAIAIARTHSLVPRIHGVDIKSFSQLYPLLIAPAFRHGLIPADLRLAHLLNAWIMSSACIPAYLLARRVTARRGLAYVVAALTVSVPWIVYSSFLLTEVVAYPMFLWAMLALQRMVAAPSARNDVVAALAIALAFFARTAFIVLAVVPPLAVLALELADARDAAGLPGRVVTAVRRSVGRHRTLAGIYALFVAGILVLLAIGSFSSVYGVYSGYGSTVDKNLVPHGFARSFVDHLATLSLGLAILPVVLGLAWLLANVVRPPAARELHAFACVATVTVLAVLYQATTFDLSLPSPFVHDRFMFHLAPLLLIAAVCALTGAKRPRWSLVVPTAVVAVGFAVATMPYFTWGEFPDLNPDTPVAAFYEPLVSAAHTASRARLGLAVATVLLAALFVVGARLLRRNWLTAVVLAVMLVVLPVLSAYPFIRLFRVNGLSDRPITATTNGSDDWLDSAVGTTGSVTMIPYPVSTDWFVSQRVWRDYEWWNKSVVRDVHYAAPGIFDYTGIWFPKLFVHFNPSTGAADASPTRYVLGAVQETRFHLAGANKTVLPDVVLSAVNVPWRLDWLSFGLYDDGWTKPHVPVRVRVFPKPGQHEAIVRYLTFQVHLPDSATQRPFVVSSNLETKHDVATTTSHPFVTVRVCVPAHGFTDVRLATPGVSAIPGDQRDTSTINTPRRGGVFVNEIALADEVGSGCRPR